MAHSDASNSDEGDTGRLLIVLLRHLQSPCIVTDPAIRPPLDKYEIFWRFDRFRPLLWGLPIQETIIASFSEQLLCRSVHDRTPEDYFVKTYEIPMLTMRHNRNIEMSSPSQHSHRATASGGDGSAPEEAQEHAASNTLPQGKKKHLPPPPSPIESVITQTKIRKIPAQIQPGWAFRPTPTTNSPPIHPHLPSETVTLLRSITGFLELHSPEPHDPPMSGHPMKV